MLIEPYFFQGILVDRFTVVNEVIEIGTLPEVLRIIISNGIILYALSKTKGGNQMSKAYSLLKKAGSALFDNKVMIAFAAICLGGYPASGSPLSFIVDGVFTRITRTPSRCWL